MYILLKQNPRIVFFTLTHEKMLRKGLWGRIIRQNKILKKITIVLLIQYSLINALVMFDKKKIENNLIYKCDLNLNKNITTLTSKDS